jgi:spoIIIJ-associated protein
MIFEAKTLEEAYKKIGEYFNMSVSELDIKIIQSPSKGIFGFFSKTAILEVDKSQKIEEEDIVDKIKTKPESETKTETEKVEIETTIEKDIVAIKEEVNRIFSFACFNIDEIDVKVYDDETIIFKIDGEDSALLIGKEGYRYNALSTLLFNWISQKYGYRTKLEIASFLESQEEMMRNYLGATIREIEEKGRCKTKPFDGVLAYIAVEILRAEFPHKYVAIKRNRDGSQYVIVNDFLNKKDG